jgi:small subunit ribosomal protein S7
MRRSKPIKRVITPDVRYQSVLLQNFINHIMRRGKKSVAAACVYNAMDLIQEQTGKAPLEIFDLAMKNVGPVMEVRPRRVGGATYQVPMEVPQDRRVTLAMRWILESSRARSGKSFAEKLSSELVEASNNQGASIRKREETHKMAEANRAFSHYRM